MYLLSHIFLILNKNRGLVGVSLKKNETVKGLICLRKKNGTATISSLISKKGTDKNFMNLKEKEKKNSS